MFKGRLKLDFKGDKVLWYIIIILMLASIMVVYSSTGQLAYREKGGNTSFYLIKQLILMLGCIGVIIGLQSVHYKYFLTFTKVVLGKMCIRDRIYRGAEYSAGGGIFRFDIRRRWAFPCHIGSVRRGSFNGV